MKLPPWMYTAAGFVASYTVAMVGTVLAIRTLDDMIHTRWMHVAAGTYLVTAAVIVWQKIDRRLH